MASIIVLEFKKPVSYHGVKKEEIEYATFQAIEEDDQVAVRETNDLNIGRTNRLGFYRAYPI